jgi:hypothetical protein
MNTFVHNLFGSHLQTCIHGNVFLHLIACTCGTPLTQPFSNGVSCMCSNTRIYHKLGYGCLLPHPFNSLFIKLCTHLTLYSPEIWLLLKKNTNWRNVNKYRGVQKNVLTLWVQPSHRTHWQPYSLSSSAVSKSQLNSVMRRSLRYIMEFSRSYKLKLRAIV